MLRLLVGQLKNLFLSRGSLPLDEVSVKIVGEEVDLIGAVLFDDATDALHVVMDPHGLDQVARADLPDNAMLATESIDHALEAQTMTSPLMVEYVLRIKINWL